LEKSDVATVMPMVENHKRPRTSHIPEVSTNKVPPLCLLTPTTTSSPDFDASAAIVISLQKYMYASLRKGSPAKALPCLSFQH
jgi:hypothetical protein